MDNRLLSRAAYRNAAGIWVDPGDNACDMHSIGTRITYGDNQPDDAIIYLFCNDPSGDGTCYAMAHDGTVLASHWCSHPAYMKHDLHDSDSRAAVRGHYPDGYTLAVLTHATELPRAVYNRNQERRRAADTAKAAE